MFSRIIFIVLIFSGFSAIAQKMPPTIGAAAAEPVIYTGGLQPDSSLFDGGIPHAMGVHHFQAMRANRTHPIELNSDKGWTYNHQPYLAYWNGKFYLQYLSGEFSEHTPPTRVLMMTSVNGKDWTRPEVVFPVYTLPEIKTSAGYLPAGTKAVMHQRMGFYKAPNGKLLTLGFYSYTITPRFSPNAGQGLGRVVREVKTDGSYGPVYFIRYNRHNGYNETNTNFPFYKTSKDKEFLAACDSLLNNKLITLQWWEEDRGKDGFYSFDPSDAKGAEAFSQNVTTSAGAGKAFSFYHRPDGVVVGMWKNQWSALSADEGKTWTTLTKNKSFSYTGAKVWGQRLDNGHYAIVRNQTAGHKNRYPMVVMAGEDGHIFDRMYSLRDDNPQTRYQGLHKGIGPQYYRGIVEGNGNPPGNEMWVVYSVNKEDIWITSIDVPVRGEELKDVKEDFSAISKVQDLKSWNLYIPQWAPLSIARETNGNKYLQLKDAEPYDYAKAERIFPESKITEISFRVNAMDCRQGRALEIEVQGTKSERAMRLRLDHEWMMFDLLDIEPEPVRFDTQKWVTVKLLIDTEKNSYDAYYNGELVRKDIGLATKVVSINKIIFRTGPYRGYTNAQTATRGPAGTTGTDVEDLAGADEKVAEIVYGIDDLSVKKIK